MEGALYDIFMQNSNPDRRILPWKPARTEISVSFAFYLEDIWDFDFHRMDWHWHPELEFLVVQEGTIHCSVGIRRFDLEQGYGLFINRSILHRFEANNHAIIPNIVFSPVFLAAEQTGIYQGFIHPLVKCCNSFSDIFSGSFMAKEHTGQSGFCF